MPQPRKSIPRYLEHKQSGQGRLVWTDHLGIRQEKLLPGLFGSPASLAAKARLELELSATPIRKQGTERETVSVNELFLAFDDHAQQHYRRADGIASGSAIVLGWRMPRKRMKRSTQSWLTANRAFPTAFFF